MKRVMVFLSGLTAVLSFLFLRRAKKGNDQKRNDNPAITLPEAFKRISSLVKEFERKDVMMSSIIRKDGEGDEIGCVIIETKVDEKKRNLILIFGIRYNEDLIQIDGKDGKSLYTMLNPERIKKAFQKVEEILSEELRVGA